MRKHMIVECDEETAEALTTLFKPYVEIGGALGAKKTRIPTGITIEEVDPRHVEQLRDIAKAERLEQECLFV